MERLNNHEHQKMNDEVQGIIAEAAEDYGDDEDDDGGFNYEEFGDEDMFQSQPPITSQRKDTSNDGDFSFVNKSSLAVLRLRNDLKQLTNIDPSFGIHGRPRGDNLFFWDVELTDIPNDTQLGKDLEKYSKKYQQPKQIQMEMRFSDDYPMSPPFVRIIRPKFKFLSGHVTIGGSICMQLLTTSGWLPSNDLESILIQIRATILSDPNAALDGSNHEYSETEAKSAFIRMAAKYGWN